MVCPSPKESFKRSSVSLCLLLSPVGLLPLPLAHYISLYIRCTSNQKRRLGIVTMLPNCLTEGGGEVRMGAGWYFLACGRERKAVDWW